jgi:hypothetical protein
MSDVASGFPGPAAGIIRQSGRILEWSGRFREAERMAKVTQSSLSDSN